MKTHRGAAKRFRVKPGGKIKRKKQGLRHLLEHKSAPRKRALGQGTYVDSANLKAVQRQLLVK